MLLISTAFSDNGRLPAKYTFDGANVSPPLLFRNVSKQAKSLALVMDDPDAPSGNWDHWIVWNIPPETTTVPEATQPKGIRGMNDFHRLGYDGPSPPSGTHTYVWKLYALDRMIPLKEGARKKDLEKAMEGHIIEQAQLKGKYSR